MKRELWLISKHGNDIGDNAFIFFQYMRKEHPEVKCVYVADKKEKNAYETARKVGTVVQYRSIYHKLLYLVADKIITSHVGDSEPWHYDKIIEMRQKYPKWTSRQKTVFLQHGVIDKNISFVYDKSKRPVDLFICSTLPEMKYVSETLHYREEELACTGLARFDEWWDAKTQKKILLIPRYRKDVMMQLRENKKKLIYSFKKSAYYRRYQSLMENKELLDLLEVHGYQLVFFPHYEVQPLIEAFRTYSDLVVIADVQTDTVDAMLKECAFMITDYSSVAFDFAYMNKPMLYYQFDREEFECEMGGSYFSHEKDGFGPVVDNEEDVVRNIKDFFEGNFDVNGMYEKRRQDTFLHHDDKHCQRIYEQIVKL